jgi:hypothetical protein
MFRAALYIIAKTWKPCRYLSVGERINKLAQAYNRIVYRNKNKLVTCK